MDKYVLTRLNSVEFHISPGFCDEVWVVSIDEQEALQRLMARNGLSAEAAQARINSQMANSERISHADVVLSTFFSPEETQQFVERAWTLLQDRLLQRQNISSGLTLEARFYQLIQ